MFYNDCFILEEFTGISLSIFWIAKDRNKKPTNHASVTVYF